MPEITDYRITGLKPQIHSLRLRIGLLWSYLNKQNKEVIKPKVNKINARNEILLVSQYRPFKKNKPHDTIHTIRNTFHGLKFSWRQFHQANIDLALQLKEFCQKNNLSFGIVGARVDDAEKEKLFYTEKLGKNDWRFINN